MLAVSAVVTHDDLRSSPAIISKGDARDLRHSNRHLAYVILGDAKIERGIFWRDPRSFWEDARRAPLHYQRPRDGRRKRRIGSN
jgi:hypothetical protein